MTGEVIVNLDLKVTKISLNPAEIGVVDVEVDLHVDKIFHKTFSMKGSIADGEFQLVKSEEPK